MGGGSSTRKICEQKRAPRIETSLLLLPCCSPPEKKASTISLPTPRDHPEVKCICLRKSTPMKNKTRQKNTGKETKRNETFHAELHLHPPKIIPIYMPLPKHPCPSPQTRSSPPSVLHDAVCPLFSWRLPAPDIAKPRATSGRDVRSISNHSQPPSPLNAQSRPGMSKR